MQGIVPVIAKLVMKAKRVRKIPVESGSHTADELYRDIIQKNYKTVFISSSKTVRNKGMLDKLIKNLNDNGVRTVVFSDIVSDPTIENVENGLKLLKENECDCVIAAGGGSVLDCSKVIALRATNPHVSVKMMGLLIFPCRKSLPIYVIPTTSGTGSEITFFSVITDLKKKKKFPVMSGQYMPEKIIFDYELLRHVPEKPTVYSGFDALTHSIESFISTFSQTFSDDVASAPEVCRDIFRYLPVAAKEPDNMEARLGMAQAAYGAGINFRRASVGYVHAIAHRIGESYKIPHGLACAAVLPHVLEKSLPQAEKRLKELAVKSGISDSAEGLIQKIRDLERELRVPEKFEEIKTEDIPAMIGRILPEAGMQGCPAILRYKDVEEILLSLILSEKK